MNSKGKAEYEAVIKSAGKVFGSRKAKALFNPVMENKIMASTVMVVLGLRDRIGKTDSAAVNAIFDALKAA